MQETYTAYRRDTGAPVEFPVDWPNPEDAERNWRWDAEHNAFPLTPLSAGFGAGAAGMERALLALRGEVRPGGSIQTHGYRYSGGGRGNPFGASNPQYQETLERLAPKLKELWFQTWRPSIESSARAIWDRDYADLSLSELVDSLEELAETTASHSDLMFRALHLVTHSRSRLVDFCESYLGDATEGVITEVLQGVDNVSVQSGAALWQIAQLAKGKAALRELLQSASASPEAIALVEGGPELLERFRDWLDAYGRRNGAFGEIAEATWLEDPRVPLKLMAYYMDAKNPRDEQRRAAVRREELTASIEGQLPSDAERTRFRGLLEAALDYLPVRESRPFATGMSRASLRVPILTFGRKLREQGLIDEPADVFFLTFSELRSASSGLLPAAQQLVAQRRSEQEYWRNVVPPPVIGPAARQPTETGDTVTGLGGSGGVVEGIARVVMTLDEGDRLQPGDILVTRTTAPLWTPLFSVVSGIVTDGGGVLSHCAIVAREYGIPAVVGAQSATHRIRDGARILVDGTSGIVRILTQD